jgi:hypothetical protein
MINKICWRLVLIALCYNIAVANDLDNQGLVLDLRILVDNQNSIYLCSVENRTQQEVAIVDSFFSGQFNAFSIFPMDMPNGNNQRWILLAGRRRIGEQTLPRTVMIQPSGIAQWSIDRERVADHRHKSYMFGRYNLWGWEVIPWQNNIKGSGSQLVCIGMSDPEGNIAPPVVDPRDPTAKPILAFVFNENQTNGVGFLFLNGSNETVNVEKPLTQASRIIATAPAIEYTKELYIAGQPSESIAIEAGKVGEWRIPWKTIRDLIPEADLNAIKAAGGDLDLVWKVGNFQSDPLPISLAEPVKNVPPE